MVGLQMIPNKTERELVARRLEKTGKEIVELSANQIAKFAGNAIELHDENGEKLLVLSLAPMEHDRKPTKRFEPLRAAYRA